MSDHHDPHRLYAIAELADELGITPRAIRFYESKGLLSPRRAGSTRIYDYRDHARLRIILRGKRLGFTLALIQEYLDLHDADPTGEGQLRHLLRNVRQRLGELEAQRHDLEVTTDELREIEMQTVAAIDRLGDLPRADEL